MNNTPNKQTPTDTCGSLALASGSAPWVEAAREITKAISALVASQGGVINVGSVEVKLTECINRHVTSFTEAKIHKLERNLESEIAGRKHFLWKISELESENARLRDKLNWLTRFVPTLHHAACFIALRDLRENDEDCVDELGQLMESLKSELPNA